MTTCTAPITSTTLCGAPATDSRLVDGVLCPLCDDHALQLDAEREVADAISLSADEHRTVTIRATSDAYFARLVDALSLEQDDSAEWREWVDLALGTSGATKRPIHVVEAWGDSDDGHWTVRVEVVS